MKEVRNPAPATRGEMIWLALKLFGVPMFFFMTAVGVVIPWWTMGKPMNLDQVVDSAIVNLILIPPVTVLFGLGMWHFGRRPSR